MASCWLGFGQSGFVCKFRTGHFGKDFGGLAWLLGREIVGTALATTATATPGRYIERSDFIELQNTSCSPETKTSEVTVSCKSGRGSKQTRHRLTKEKLERKAVNFCDRKLKKRKDKKAARQERWARIRAKAA